jgi:hypothetical protein
MYPYLSLPLENMSYYPIQIDVVATPTSEKGYWANINGEVRYLGCARFPRIHSHRRSQPYPTPPYLPIPPNHGINNESVTLLPVTGAPVAGLPLVCPSNSTPPTPPNFPVASILPGTSHIPPPVESREKREPQDRPYQYQKLKKKGEVESLHWSRRPADIRKARIPRFLCDECGAEYAQRQGLNRHHREKHEPSLCMYCDAEWGRPYEYRDHLEKHHPDVDRDMILGKTAGSRRRSASFARHRSQQVSLPTIEHGPRGHSGIRRYSPAVVKPSTVTLSPPDMTCVPLPESTQPIMTSKSIPEGAVNLDYFILLILIALFHPIALRGAPQDGYAGRPSNPEMTLITALTPTVDGWQPEFVPSQPRGRPGAENCKKPNGICKTISSMTTLGHPYNQLQIPRISYSMPFFPS